MDTLVNIKVVHTDSKKANEAIKVAFGEIERIECLMDFYHPESGVSKINRSQGEMLEVAPEIIDVITTSLRYSELTKGAFDITIGPLIKLWGFKKGEGIPDREKLREALKLVGYQKIKVDREGKTVMLLQPGAMIDLGGVAKGYAVTKACQRLKDMGISSALIDAGGDIQVMGGKFGRPWRLGVQHPREKNRLTAILELNEGAVATSGDYERFFIFKDRRYHHILDPVTGFPARECISVTITAASCLVADILSTAVFILGPDEGMRLIEEMEGVEGIIVTEEGVLFSTGIERFIVVGDHL